MTLVTQILFKLCAKQITGIVKFFLHKFLKTFLYLISSPWLFCVSQYFWLYKSEKKFNNSFIREKPCKKGKETCKMFQKSYLHESFFRTSKLTKIHDDMQLYYIGSIIACWILLFYVSNVLTIYILAMYWYD